MSDASQKSGASANRFELEQHFELPDKVPPHNEGQTVAAWFAMLGIILGAIVATVGICLASIPVVAVGAAVIAAGLLGGLFLRLAGHGQRR
ncbi:hypothetical protein GCM10010401_22160 [Rarobacter faecitabidus]|uniref:Uncharacterized protein n=1 Tax=Rarobacter faecitabidus TaxID=13243 RepID=A0A542ZW43_RARFA|nr:HGxxPAAW family protein [Rarobacter faecitabidus]TQL64420.1 hypothetical protein FB461_0923 [Rarobacter faecitabidus]